MTEISDDDERLVRIFAAMEPQPVPCERCSDSTLPALEVVSFIYRRCDRCGLVVAPKAEALNEPAS
jgi:hypothetical protein